MADINLTNPDVQKIATKARLDQAVLEAHVPLVDDAGVHIRDKTFFVDLREGHPVAVQNKVTQTIIDMAVYLGIIPPQS